MALSDLQRTMLYSTHNYIWQQDMLLNAYFHGSSVGANLREMMIGQPPVQPLTSPFDEAITGKLRSDSRAISQNAGNVREAAQMVGIAAEAVGTIKTTLEEMQDLAQSIKEERDLYYDEVGSEDGTFETSQANKDDYQAMKDKILSIIEYTNYNNIPLLDSSQWADAEQIDADGNVFIKGLPGREGGFDVTFRALDEMEWDELNEEHLDDDGRADWEDYNVETQLEALNQFIGDVTLMEDIYTRRESGLEYQANSLDSQALILDQAVEARRQTPTLSLEEILLNLLHRYSGTLIDETS